MISYTSLIYYIFNFRCFTARMTKSEVYGTVQVPDHSEDNASSDDSSDTTIFRNHEFDRPVRNGKKKRNRRVKLSEDKCLHGVKSVRELAFKINESVVPPLDRMQIAK